MTKGAACLTAYHSPPTSARTGDVATEAIEPIVIAVDEPEEEAVAAPEADTDADEGEDEDEDEDDDGGDDEDDAADDDDVSEVEWVDCGCVHRARSRSHAAAVSGGVVGTPPSASRSVWRCSALSAANGVRTMAGSGGKAGGGVCADGAEDDDAKEKKLPVEEEAAEDVVPEEAACE